MLTQVTASKDKCGFLITTTTTTKSSTAYSLLRILRGGTCTEIHKVIFVLMLKAAKHVSSNIHVHVIIKDRGVTKILWADVCVCVYKFTCVCVLSTNIVIASKPESLYSLDSLSSVFRYSAFACRTFVKHRAKKHT